MFVAYYRVSTHHQFGGLDGEQLPGEDWPEVDPAGATWRPLEF